MQPTSSSGTRAQTRSQPAVSGKEVVQEQGNARNEEPKKGNKKDGKEATVEGTVVQGAGGKQASCFLLSRLRSRQNTIPDPD